jgi:hypothetical protein
MAWPMHWGLLPRPPPPRDEETISSERMRSETAIRRRRTPTPAVEGDSSRVLPQVKTDMVGLAGLEPAPSSLSEMDG